MERIKCVKDNSNEKTCLENLSNEIFYEIFDYLDGYTIYNGFSLLNQRFHRLFVDSPFLLKISIDIKTRLDSNYKTFLDTYRGRLISIDFPDDNRLDLFTRFYTINSSFTHLESIRINEKTLPFRLIYLLFHFQKLTRLRSLNIGLDSFFDNLGDIYHILFQFSTLNYLKLTIPDNELLDIDFPMSNDHFSSLKYLIVNHCVTLNQMIELLQNTRELVQLNCCHVVGLEDDIISTKSVNLPKLKRLIINLNDVDFDEFHGFLIKLCSQLEYFTVSIEGLDKSYLDGDRWEEFITKEMIHLKEFQFSFVDFIYDPITDPFYSSINRFTSSFWIERKWIFGISLKDGYMTYSIRPSYKVQSDFAEHNSTSSLNNFLPGAYLRIDGCLQILRNPLSNIISTVLQLVDINRLSIRCNRLSIEMFIRLLLLLPNLNAIRLIDLPSDDNMYKFQLVNTDDVRRFLTRNQITKITLTNPTEVQMNLILTCFTRLQSFAFEKTSNVDLRPVLRCILTKSNRCQPIRICVYGDLQNLELEQENFFDQFQIIREQNRIVIQTN